MKISQKGQYALTIMKDLCLHGGAECVKTKDISKRTGIPIKFLEQIINMLSKAKLVRAERGRFGGYKPIKQAGEYTVGEILRVTEGALEPVEGLEDGNVDNFEFWMGLCRLINEYADSTTVADLSAADSDNFGCYI